MMTATTNTLSVVKLDGFKMVIDEHTEVHLSGWGLFDSATNSYLSLNDTLQCGFIIPYALRAKKTAQLVAESGIQASRCQLIPQKLLQKVC